MKKILNITILILLVVGLTACGNETTGNGTIKVDANKTEKHKIGDLSFELPDIYVKSDSTSEDYASYFVKDYDTNYETSNCDFNFIKSKIYSFTGSIKEELGNHYKDTAHTQYDKREFDTKTINGNVWTTLDVTSTKTETTGAYYSKIVYSIDHNEERYTVTLSDYYPKGKYCDKIFEVLIKSLKFE